MMPRAFAFIRQRSRASATTMSSSTGRGSGTGSTAWIRDSVIRSWTRLVSRCASWRILPANRRTASASSAASSMVSASRASAPTGVLSSWLVLATKSRLTSSTRRLSVWSSASTRTSPPPPTAAPSGATRTADLAVPPDLAGQGGQFGDHEPVALDQAEGAGRGARPQHPVVAVHDHGGGGQHRQDRGDAGRQPRGLVSSPDAVGAVGPHGARSGGSYSHAISAVRAGQGRERGRLTGSMVCGSSMRKTAGLDSPGDIRRLFTYRTNCVYLAWLI